MVSSSKKFIYTIKVTKKKSFFCNKKNYKKDFQLKINKADIIFHLADLTFKI